MRKTAMTRGLCLTGLIFFLLVPAEAGVRFRIDNDTELELGWWMQGWYQHTGKERQGGAVSDFILRRNYFSLRGELAPWLGAFTHIASDRIGQDGLDQPSLGLGSGIAFRDAWVVVRIHEGMNLQLGRMYVPLTRNYGTHQEHVDDRFAVSPGRDSGHDLLHQQGGPRRRLDGLGKSAGRTDPISVHGLGRCRGYR